MKITDASIDSHSPRDFDREIEDAIRSAKQAAGFEFLGTLARLVVLPLRRGANLLLSNHSEFDNAVNKIRMMAGRGEGRHPFELGSEMVQRYFQVTEGGARAAQLGLEKQSEIA